MQSVPSKTLAWLLYIKHQTCRMRFNTIQMQTEINCRAGVGGLPGPPTSLMLGGWCRRRRRRGSLHFAAATAAAS